MTTKPDADFKIWEGIYDRFPAGASVSAFANAAMLDRWSQKINEGLAGVEAKAPTEDISVAHEYPITVLLALLASERKISVLDFGGGLGQTFLSVRAASPHADRIHYYVVELAELVTLGNSLFAESAVRPRFKTTLDEIPDKLDVVHFGAAFHYIDDWRGFLDAVAKRSPEYIAFGHVLAGDIEPFISLQNYWSNKIPVRFHNIQELKAALSNLGYDTVYDVFHCHRIFGDFQPLPTEHFPANRRIQYSRDLIARKRKP